MYLPQRDDIGIVIPWRTSPSRELGFSYAQAWLDSDFNGISRYFGDSYAESFNRSEARNNGCKKAIADGKTILIVIDADVLLPSNKVAQSVSEVLSRDVVSKPFSRVETISPVDNDAYETIRLQVDTERESTPLPQNPNNSDDPGSCWVLTSKVYKELGGWDERFTTWGFEDDAFNLKATKLYGHVHYVKGLCFKLEHAERDLEDYDKNKTLYNSMLES